MGHHSRLELLQHVFAGRHITFLSMMQMEVGKRIELLTPCDGDCFQDSFLVHSDTYLMVATLGIEPSPLVFQTSEDTNLQHSVNGSQ